MPRSSRGSYEELYTPFLLRLPARMQIVTLFKADGDELSLEAFSISSPSL